MCAYFGCHVGDVTCECAECSSTTGFCSDCNKFPNRARRDSYLSAPDDYCRAVSASQGFRGLGNGWTAEVIIHLLQHAKIPLNDEITVISMYDGIGTGRYCLDKMGYKNVKYYAYEIDKYAIQIAKSNYPDIVELGDAFAVRNDNWLLETLV